MFRGRTLKKNAKFYTTVFIAGLVFLTTLTSVGFAALNQNLNIAGQLEYEKHEVWAENLSYDNSNTGVNCDTAQCMLDCLADDSLCPPLDFATASWSDIANASQEELQAIMEAGTTKDVDLGEFGVHQVRIANVSTPSECSGSGFSQTACGFVIEFADIITTHRMNPYTDGTTNGDGNKGGWPASEMRTYVNSDIYNALPTELKSVIINTTVVSGYGENDSSNFTSTDKLYLLSTHEVWQDGDGDTSYGIDYYDKAYNNTRQLDYYSSQNVTTSSYSGAIKQQNGSNSSWWLRSATFRNSYHFYSVADSGNWETHYSDYTTPGVSPAFRIG